MYFLGDKPAGSTLYVPFATYNSDGASVTITGLATTDIEIYKNGSVTQRASDNGYALLDTDGIDFDSTTGLHGFSVDLSDNSDSGFYAAGSEYWLVVNAVTCDSQTIILVFTFRIVAAETIAGTPKVDVGAVSGDATAADTLELFVEAVDQSTGQLDSGSFANGAITAAAIADGAIDAATFAADVDAEFLSYIVDDATRIDASALNTATGTTIPAILDDTDLIDDGTSGLAKIATDVAAILVDTADMQPKLGTPSASLAADIAAVLARTPSATSITNMNTVFATDFAANYNTTNDAWVVKLGDYAHGGTSAAVTVASVQCGGTLNVDGAVTFGSTFAVSDTVTFVSGLVAAITGNITGNLSGSVGSVTAGVTVTTNNDKTGYALSSTGLNSTTLPANLITASSIAANAFTSAKFASDYTDRLETDILGILEGNAVTDFTVIPAGTPTYSEALGMVAAAILNKVISDRTAGKSYIHDGDNNVIGEADITDDGTTFTRTKYAAP